jgi:hypothetical protein
MSQKEHATIGDALIFLTKAAVLALFVLGIGVAAWWWSIIHNDRVRQALATEQALSREALNQADLLNRKMQEQQITIADLGNKLNTCLAAQSGVPLPPEGFVIEPRWTPPDPPDGQ